MGKALLSSKDSAFLDDRLHLVTVTDGEMRQLMGHDVIFFDIRSTKAKQFGFSLELADGRLTCCGDEPYQPWEEAYVRDSKWLLHEAFCSMPKRISSIPMKNTIRPSKTPAKRQPAWAYRI